MGSHACAATCSKPAAEEARFPGKFPAKAYDYPDQQGAYELSAANIAYPHLQNQRSAAYDYTKSTEDNYSVPHFMGANADIRPLLDYTWHRTYTPARVLVQDAMIENLCRGGGSLSSDLPWVIFTAGAMGAGKGYVIRWMDKGHYLPLQNFVMVDPDQIRQTLPEWDSYVQHDASRAGDLTQKEAGCIAEILGYRALRQRANVIFDGSLRDVNWYTTYFRHLREQFPGIRIMILHIVANKDEVLKRAEARGKETGRVVPIQTLLSSMQAVPKSVEALAPFADFVCKVSNEGSEPVLCRQPGAPNPPASVNLTWDLFHLLWKPIDVDGDGSMSKEEVDAAIALGVLTEDVVKTLDSDCNGAISVTEIRSAKIKAGASGRKLWK